MNLEKEFEYEIDGVTEYFTVVDIITINGVDYVIADNEYGFKKVFIYDIMEEELTPVDEDEEEEILDSYENNDYEKSAFLDETEAFSYTDDDGEYAEYDDSDTDLEDNFIVEDIEEDGDIDEDFLESLF